MLKIKLLLFASGIMGTLLAGTCLELPAQRLGSDDALEFKQGERILFLGGSLFENELKNGYLEYAISSRWPDKDLTFRNLGWTGDNVFAEARSTFTSPPTPYQQLFQQIRSTHPDRVLIAYGGVESQKGEAGLDAFVNGLGVLIDSVDALGAQTILLSTIPVKHAGSSENTITQNENLKLYADAISSMAAKRKKRYIDLYTPLAGNTDDIYLDNGIHLNDAGYYFLAQVIEQSFGWPPRASKVTVNTAKSTATASGPAKIISSDGDHVVFSIEEPVLPLPVPDSGKPVVQASVSVQINGLADGYYTLTEEGRQLVTASAADWATGMVLDHGISQEQAAEIGGYIVKKNELFFEQYRPLNRTYILGFRSYEQGRHKQGLEDLDLIIAWLEGQINLHRKPVIKTYELSQLNKTNR
ncbi:GDSL-type esterase/lipase family protein [Parapedobacter sp. 10938]|uniref:GDSL-type esterase/lipase family protein n=1 Tax=Parapedobacter flavus TaxID=3110225 RepID=UPI002DB6A01A|nr:GDSL-type esterase/lipase family protein [Parapedobacter sp. 10938]MEC3880472.1 GDSL-type esterase/lipase family protein [Parapedobacter sp. 10938]